MVAAIPIAMLALTAASTAASAAASAEQGEAQQKAANYNAGVATQEAGQEEQVAQTQAQQVRRENQQTIGQAIANAGASGVDPNQGSPLSVMSDIATQGELNRRLTLWQGSSQATALRNQAALDIYGGQQSASAGANTAFTTFLQGGARAASLYTKTPSYPTTTSGGGQTTIGAYGAS